MPNIYLDHAASTPLLPSVLEAMLPYFSEYYGNAESLHQQGIKSKIALDRARKTVSEILNCHSKEIVFTGSGTEANNLAILGIAKTAQHKHLITSKIEHPSILEPCQYLEKQGWQIDYLDVDQEGFVNLEQLEESLQSPSALVSIIHANNEIGTIQDIAAISKLCQEHNTLLHIDACQSANYLQLDLPVDLMTLNSSKIYGPKGVGALYIKQNTPIAPITYGGDQENKLRPGTQNIPGIVGFAKALEIVQSDRETESKRLREISEKFIQSISAEIPDSKVNGATRQKIPNNISLCIPGCSASEMLLRLDDEEIYISTGSACKIGSAKASHVLQALKLSKSEILSTIRISLGRQSTAADLELCAEKIIEISRKIRANRFQKV